MRDERQLCLFEVRLNLRSAISCVARAIQRLLKPPSRLVEGSRLAACLPEGACEKKALSKA